jgi:hypothetical protein
VTAHDFLTGLPPLGESELYDEICERLSATNDGQRAGDRACFEGSLSHARSARRAGGGEWAWSMARESIVASEQAGTPVAANTVARTGVLFGACPRWWYDGGPDPLVQSTFRGA